MADPAPAYQINRRTPLSLDILIAIGLPMFTAVYWVHTEINDLTYEVRRVIERQDEVLSDRWTQTEMGHWATELQLLNPNVAIPSVE